jgi:MFS family permease
MDLVTGTTTESESHLSYHGWKVALSGFFGVMVSFSAIVPYTFSLFLKPLSLSFGWHREAISAGFSIAGLTVAGAAPVLGFLLDRFGPRRIILPCILVFSATYASMALLTPHLMRFYLSFFVIGLVGAGTSFLGYSRAISTWFERRRGAALSIMLAGAGLGAMILPVIAQATITRYGWRTAFAVLGLLALALGFPLSAWWVRERPAAKQNVHISVDVGESVGKALTGRIFWIIAVTVCLPSISANGAVTHLSALLTDRGVSTQGAAYAIATIGATALIGRLLTGMFVDRFFGPRVYQTMLVMSGGGIILLSVAHTLTAAMVAASLIGFSTGGEADITPYLIGRYFGLRRLSTLYAFTWTSYSIGSAIGPLIVGRLFDTLGSYRPATIQLLSLPTFVPCVLMFLLPRYADRVGSRKAASLEPFAEVTAANIPQ